MLIDQYRWNEQKKNILLTQKIASFLISTLNIVEFLKMQFLNSPLIEYIPKRRIVGDTFSDDATHN